MNLSLIFNNLRYKLFLFLKLFNEAGKIIISKLILLAILGTIAEVFGLSIFVKVLFDNDSNLFSFLSFFEISNLIFILLILVFIRGFTNSLVAILKIRIRNIFADDLRQDLFKNILFSSNNKLINLGKGEMLGSLLNNITRSSIALEQSVNILIALISMFIYSFVLFFFGKQVFLPLSLGLLANLLAIAFQKSSSWKLGKMQNKLSASISRTIGDSVYGLKTIKALAAENWFLNRFKSDNYLYRRMLSQTIKRQAVFTNLKDLFVVLTIWLWIIVNKDNLSQAYITASLLFAYRFSSSASVLINSQRLCMRSLTAYEELLTIRKKIVYKKLNISETFIKEKNLKKNELIQNIKWINCGFYKEKIEELNLNENSLTVIKGPSGSGKTTLIDQFCGLLTQEKSQWILNTKNKKYKLKNDEFVFFRKFWTYSPQNTILFEGSLRQNLIIGDDIGEKSLFNQNTIAIRYWLNKVGLENLFNNEKDFDKELNLAIDCFSGGEIRRLGLIRSWIRNKQLEIMDEPTAFLDENSADLISKIILERKNKKIIFIATHDEKIINIADQVINL